MTKNKQLVLAALIAAQTAFLCGSSANSDYFVLREYDGKIALFRTSAPQPITVYEKAGEYVNGRWVETKQNERLLYGILLNVDEKRQEIVAQGRNIVGAYCVMFEDGADELYVSYQQNSEIKNLQSYLVIDGLEYVVVNNPETVKNAGFRSYYALRFKEQVKE